MNLKIFRDLLEVSKRVDYDLNTPYGAELSHKTILHLALEEEDGFPYVEELLLVSFNRNNLSGNHATFYSTVRPPHITTVA